MHLIQIENNISNLTFITVHFMLSYIYFNCIVFTYVFVKAVKFGYLQFKLNHAKYD